MILVFTNKEDAHPNPVFDILTDRGVPFFRLNTEDLLTNYVFSWCANTKGFDFKIVDNNSGLSIKGSEISAVWERRPEPVESLPIHNTTEIDAHNLREGQAFLQFIRHYIAHIPSIGSIVRDRVSSSKMMQYRVAHDCGFTFPDTVFSNNKASILELARKYERVCVKPIDGLNVCDYDNNVDYVFFSQVLDSAEIDTIPDEAFHQTVSFIQEYVPKDFELRVTVVDSVVIATKIHSQELPEGKGKEDWRQGYDYGLVFEEFHLPECIENKCRTLVHALGLNFGCLDLIVRPDGEYVFLECNPNGQWLWIELATGQKIAEAIADFFTSLEQRRRERCTL